MYYSLLSELHSKDIHFILEFVQNADDNTYDTEATPELVLDCYNDKIIIECNETGFTPANVRAVCQFGETTKQKHMGYIGEKTIGFKSAFKFADVVHVASKGYTFKFDSNQELGMLCPIWEDFPNRIKPGWTQYHLSLPATHDHDALEKQLADLDPSVILFLNKLRVLRINLASNTSITIKRIPQSDGIVTLEVTTNGVLEGRAYVLVEQLVKNMPQEAQRARVTESTIILAFPLDENGSPLNENQKTRSFLPIGEHGFKVS